MAIERKPIRRGGIKSAGYDRNLRVLEIEFDNGQVIQHSAVGEEIARFDDIVHGINSRTRRPVPHRDRRIPPAD